MHRFRLFHRIIALFTISLPSRGSGTAEARWLAQGLHGARRPRSALRAVYFFAILAWGVSGTAQPSSAPVFPPDRHAELREEIVFTPPEREEPEPEPDAAPFDFNWDIELSPTATIIISLLLLAGLGLLIYWILGDVDLRKRKRVAREEAGAVNLEELREEQLVAEGVSASLLTRAEAAGQFAVAVRLHYLQLLKALQDAGLIRYRRDFSNRDYREQLRDRAFVADFRDVTEDYERYWFGQYAIDRLSYRLVKRKFALLTADLAALGPQPETHG